MSASVSALKSGSHRGKGEQGMGLHANKRIYILSVADSDLVNDWGDNNVNILGMRSDFCLHLWMNNLPCASLYRSCNVQHMKLRIWKKNKTVGDQLERVYLCVCVFDVNQAVMIWKSPTGKLLLCVEFSTGHSQNTLNVKISFQSLSFHCVWQAQKSPKKDFINSGVLFMWLVVVAVLWIDWSFIWYLQSPENASF